MEPLELVAHLRAEASAAGLDLVQPFSIARWHRARRPEEPWLGQPAHLAVVFGNHRRLWTVLGQQQRLAAVDPIDHWVTTRLEAALRGTPVVERHWAHAAPPPPILRMAFASGLLSPSPIGLGLHPRHGLWSAVRAVVSFSVPWTEPAAPATRSPCEGCPAPCAAAAAPLPLPQSREDLRAAWRDWVRVREACPVGAAWRYSDAQLRYHYAGEGAPGATP